MLLLVFTHSCDVFEVDDVLGHCEVVVEDEPLTLAVGTLALIARTVHDGRSLAVHLQLVYKSHPKDTFDSDVRLLTFPTDISRVSIESVWFNAKLRCTY